MATVTILNLPGTNTVDATTVAPVVYSGTTYKATLTTLGAFINTNAATVSASGNITGAYVIGNGSQLTGVIKSIAGNLAGNIDTLEYSINSSNGEVRFGNTISVIGNATITDNLLVGDQIATTGNITSGNLLTGGLISATANVTGGNILTAGVVKTTAKTFATLPAAANIGAGARSFITDANTATFGSQVTSGGANAVPVWTNGTNWYVG